MLEHRHQHRQEQQNPQGQSPVPKIKQKLQTFKTTGLKNLPADELVAISDEMGKYLQGIGLKTTQIRRFLDGVRRIEVQSDKGKNFNPELVILLKPKLAYAAGKSEKAKPLMEVLEPAISASGKDYKDFKKLLALIEGIMAYHKYYGGGE
ncbi:MAG: type III-A CRISPR-associated protein Csm2 [Thermodesulfovibrionales bacterium]